MESLPRSSNTRQGAPAIRRAWCSAMPTCSRISGDGALSAGEFRRCFRQLAAALSRHGADRGVAGLPALRGAALCHVAAELPDAPANWLWSIHRFRAPCPRPPISHSSCASARLPMPISKGWISVRSGWSPMARSRSVQTLRNFIERFGRHGFRPEAMAPTYGLAENAVAVAFPPLGRQPLIDRVDRVGAEHRGIAEPARPNDDNALGSGRLWPAAPRL